MSAIGARPVLAGAIVVIVALSVALIWQGSLPVGIAMLVLAIAVSGPLFRRPAANPAKDAH